MTTSENGLVAKLRRLFESHDASVLLGSGPDDCAHVRADNRLLSMSTDAFAEGTHFLTDDAPEDVGWKTLAASLSDLAASACRARWALVSLCLRRGAAPDWAERFAAGLAACADAFGVSIIGGDTVSSSHGTFVSVTVMGEPLPGGPLLRRGAKPGDLLVVTGMLGGSILGKHLCPTPRLAEIRLLMDFCSSLEFDRPYPSAAMDLSDGLATDITRLCNESGVGAIIDQKLLPIAPAAWQLSRTSGKTAVDHALTDGEDFELLLCIPPDVWDAFRQSLSGPAVAGDQELALFTRIGMITKALEIQLQDEHGILRRLDPSGYEHSW